MSPIDFEEAIALQDQTERLLAEGRQHDAELCCRQAISLFESLSGAESPDVANLLNDLGEILEAQSRLGEALACASRSVSIMRGAVGQIAGSDGHRILARSLGFEGTLLRQLGRYREAEAPLKEAIAVAETALGAFDREMCVACNNLAVLYKYTGYFDEAEALYRRALDIVERGGAPDDACLATIWHNLGGLEHARGRAEIGEAYARRAWELRRAALVEEHPEMVADAAALAALLDALG